MKNKRFTEVFWLASIIFSALPSRGDRARDGIVRQETTEPEQGDLAPVRRRLLPGFALPVAGELAALCFPEPGRLLAIESEGFLSEWNLQGSGTWRSKVRLELDDSASAWCIAKDGSFVIGSSGEELARWNTANGSIEWISSAPDWITALAIDSEARHLVAGQDNGDLNLWDIATGKKLWGAQRLGPPVSVLAFSPDGRQVAFADEGCVIHVLSVFGLPGEPLELKGHKGRIVGLEWNALTGELLSASWDGTVRIWDVASRKPRMLLNDHSGPVTAMAIEPGCKSISTVDSSLQWRAWCLRTMRCLGKPVGLPAEVRNIAFAPDGTMAMGMDRSHVMFVQNGDRFDSGKFDLSDPLNVRPVICRMSGDFLLALGCHGKLASWNLKESGPVPRAFEVDGFSGRKFVSAAMDGQWLLAHESLNGGEGAAALFRLRPDGSGADRLETFQGPAGPASCMAIHSRAGWAAIGSPFVPEVWIRKIPDGTPHLIISDPFMGASVQHLAFSPDGRWLAVACIELGKRAGHLLLVDPSSGSLACRIPIGAWRIAWMPTGKELALISTDGRLLMADADGRISARYEGAESQRVVAVSGKWTVACGDDRNLRVWDSSGGNPCAAMEISSQPMAICGLDDPSRLAVLLADGGAWIIDLPTLLEGLPVA